MNKMAEYTRGRMDGLDLALRIVKRDGIEGLEKEIEFRGKTGIHLGISKKEVEQSVEDIKTKILTLFMILTVAALHDTYGFGAKRAGRVLDKLEEGAMLISNDLATWDDYIEAIKEQTGMKIEVEWEK